MPNMEERQDVDRERQLRWTLGALHFLVIAAFTWARIVRDGSLLSRLSVEWVPYLTVAVLVATALTTHLIGWLTRGRDPLHAFARVAICTGVSLLVWEVLLHDQRAWSAAALYVWVGAYGPLFVAQFWLLVHGMFDAQQARRHIGWVGALGILGGVFSGLIATGLASSLSLREVLGLTAVTHLGAGSLALGLNSRRAGDEGVEAADEGPPVRARQVLREAGYARLLALVVLLGAVTGGIVDYQFKFALQQQSRDAAELGRWLGLFNVAVSLLALGAQLATGVLLAQFGSRLLAFVLPSGVIAGAVAGIVMPGAWPPVITRLWETAARHSLARTAHEFFFFPLQGQRRAAMKHAAEGFLTRGGEVAASLLLVGLTELHRADIWHLSLLTACVGGAWIVVLGWLAQAYGPALSQSLDQLLRPGREDVRVDVDRGLAVPELAKMLASPDERHVLFALDELTAADPDRARREARRLLAHRSPAVRTRARHEATPRRAVAPGPDPRVRWRADRPLLDALRSGDRARAVAVTEEVVATRDRLAVPVLLECLNGPSRALVHDTLVRLGDAVAGMLGDTLVDPQAPLRTRRDVASVLGRIGTPAALQQLARLRRDVPRSVRSRALRALDAARKQELPFVLDEAQVRQDIEADLQELQRRLAQRASLVPLDGEAGLLLRALDEAGASTREHVFRQLALLYPAREMLRAHRGLVSGDERIRAFALEYLEATLTPEDRERVLPPLRDDEVAVTGDPDDVLRELVSDEDAWIATLATHVTGRRTVPRRDPSRPEAGGVALARP